jgi:hypothetical protein
MDGLLAQLQMGVNPRSDARPQKGLPPLPARAHGLDTGRVHTESQAYVVCHFFEAGNKRFALFGIEATAEGALYAQGDLHGAGEDRSARLGQLDQTDPSVGRVEASAHQVSCLQVVQEGHHATGGYLEAFTEGLLGKAPGRRDGAQQAEVAGFQGQALELGPEPAVDRVTELRHEEPHGVPKRHPFNRDLLVGASR